MYTRLHKLASLCLLQLGPGSLTQEAQVHSRTPNNAACQIFLETTSEKALGRWFNRLFSECSSEKLWEDRTEWIHLPGQGIGITLTYLPRDADKKHNPKQLETSGAE